MSKRDYYEILGVSRNASADELKKAYRKLAMKHHPDKNPGDEQAESLFKEASEAYQVLSKPDTRSRYDQFGHAGVDGAGFGDFSGFADDVFKDIFGAFFGGSSPFGSSKPQGRDLVYNLDLTLEEVSSGVEKEISYTRLISCEKCSGSGAKKGSAVERCASCAGSGQVRYQQGFFTYSQTCSDCRGSG